MPQFGTNMGKLLGPVQNLKPDIIYIYFFLLITDGAMLYVV